MSLGERARKRLKFSAENLSDKYSDHWFFSTDSNLCDLFLARKDIQMKIIEEALSHFTGRQMFLLLNSVWGAPEVN